MVTFFSTELCAYDSFDIQADESGLRPRFRFRKASRLVESTKISAIFPARQGFEDFGKWTKLHSKVPQSHQVSRPHNRGFLVFLKKDEFCGHYVSLIGKDASPFPVSLRNWSGMG